MNKAIYVIQNKSVLIFARDIKSRRDYKENYIGKLYCPTMGCNAQLDYVELPYFGNEKIFRTHKGSEHNVLCPYCITHQSVNAPTFSAETFAHAISEEHIKSILKGLYQRNKNPLQGGSAVHKKGTTKHRDDTASVALGRGRAVASIDVDAVPVVRGEREPSVRKRRSQDLLAEDNNRLRGIDGTVDSAYIGENYVELHFATTGCPVTLLFYNAFRDKSEQAYRLVADLAYLLCTTDLSMLVCCLGVVEMNDEKANIQIMSPEYITFEGMSIFSYMNLLAS